MDIGELKERVKLAYSSMQSYEDSGIIKCNNFGRGDGWFKTEFMRPNLLRFEWCASSFEEDKYTILVKGEKARLKLPRRSQDLSKSIHGRVEDITTVHMALSGTGGCSFGLTDTILPLLIDGARRPNFTREKLATLKDEVVDEELCYHVREIYQGFHVWISQSDFTVRRMRSDGCAVLNEALHTYYSALMNVSQFFNPRAMVLEEKHIASLESPMVSDWTLKRIKFNHLDSSIFEDFSL